MTPPPTVASTDEGKVLKVAVASGGGQDSEEISLEEISISKVLQMLPPALPCGALLASPGADPTQTAPCSRRLRAWVLPLLGRWCLHHVRNRW